MTNLHRRVVSVPAVILSLDHSVSLSVQLNTLKTLGLVLCHPLSERLDLLALEEFALHLSLLGSLGSNKLLVLLLI